MPDLHQLTEPLLDANEAARLLRVPRSTLYELVRSRHLPHIRVGRSLRFTRNDLALWIADNTYGRGGIRPWLRSDSGSRS
ncbi:MAG: helix-turn-helix domain-containing protein [Solirubrobacterales bacterium]|nr:helix-turn-helix domain-containing protein [Solirubrobacterales bacterium]